VLIQKPFRERRQLLYTHLPPTKSTFVKKSDEEASTRHIRATLDHVESIDAEQGRDAVQEFWERAVESKCEGLMIKVCRSILKLMGLTMKQLLDDAVVMVGDSDELGNDDAMEFETTPLRQTGSNIKKPRRKALPATYEPG
jgi:DNA ligase 1